MNFKQAIAREAESVFLNTAEFAEQEPVFLNGVPCNAQVIGPQSVPSSLSDGRPGIIYEQAVIHVSSNKIALPRANREIEWNGQPWIVNSASENKGIIRMELYRERS